jgi:hypothetical protein
VVVSRIPVESRKAVVPETAKPVHSPIATHSKSVG